MSVLTSPTAAPLHRDIRSESLSYKRDKEFSQKWAMGTRPSSGVKTAAFTDEMITGSEEQQAKTRPHKRWSEIHPQVKFHGNFSAGKNFKSTKQAWNLPQGRIARKQSAYDEISSGETTLSASMLGLLPSTQTSSFKDHSASTDAGITYSFDATSGPKKAVGLDALVDQAEQRFMSKETDKIVRNEYEILDVDGESVGMKMGKKSSPKHKAAVVPEITAEDDDYELV